jgi:hypothetical protein
MWPDVGRDAFLPAPRSGRFRVRSSTERHLDEEDIASDVDDVVTDSIEVVEDLGEQYAGLGIACCRFESTDVIGLVCGFPGGTCSGPVSPCLFASLQAIDRGCVSYSSGQEWVQAQGDSSRFAPSLTVTVRRQQRSGSWARLGFASHHFPFREEGGWSEVLVRSTLVKSPLFPRLSGEEAPR